MPGSPTVAERTVALLRAHPAVVDGAVDLVVHPAVSFLDLAFARLGVDPVAAGVRVVDGESFAVEAAGERGPLLVAQCWSRSVLSAIKLSVESAPSDTVTVLHHLGLDDEQVLEVAWDDLDRSFDPDHLTSLWIPRLAAPVAAELVRLDELVHTLRRTVPVGPCSRPTAPWPATCSRSPTRCWRPSTSWRPSTPSAGRPRPVDRGSRRWPISRRSSATCSSRSTSTPLLGAEAGRFTLADVARGVHDKLVSRHPHVFGDAAVDTPEDVAANWEAIKKAEKNRSSVTEGIPAALPALALAAKLQRKALAVGMVLPGRGRGGRPDRRAWSDLVG